jgi:lysophospholipase L1-like esterase
VRYVALGDSTVEGIGATSPELHYVGRLYARLRTIYPRAQLDNLGLGGATAADVVATQLRPAVALGPDLVTLSVGPNDLTQGRPVEAYEQDLERLLSTLAQQTPALIVVNLLPDLALAPAFTPDEQIQVGQLTLAFNEVITRQAQRSGAELVDLYRASREAVPGHPELVSADGYHPSDAGYARWADELWPAIERRRQS